MSTTPQIDSSANEFGWPLPKRRQHFEDVKNGATQHRQMDFMDTSWTLPVLRAPINLPKYRLLNGRTASAQEEWLAKHSDKPEDFFRHDPESDEVQRIQHGLLAKLVSGAGLLTYFKQPENKQKEPIVLDCNGFVINGNRRLCAWRTLLKEDSQRYGHFAHIDVIVLPPGDDRAIDKLEGELQVEPGIRDDYTWDSLANMMKIRQSLHGLDTKALAEFYKKKESDVKELLDILDYAAVYLEKRAKPRQWSEVSAKKHAFIEMVKKREQFANAGEKKLFEEVAFVLIDDPEGGRLYEAIPDAHKHFGAIRDGLLEAFPVTPAFGSESLSILGGEPVTSPDVPLAQEIGKDEETRKRAAGIVRNLIDMQKMLDKEKKSADFLLIQLQKANSLIQNGITAGLRPECKKDGIERQIVAIEQGLARIRKWLAENAKIAYQLEARRAILAWDGSEIDSEWVRLLRRVFNDHTEDIIQQSPKTISIPWWTFLSARPQVKEVLAGYRISLAVDDATSKLLKQSSANEASYLRAKTAPAMSTDGIAERLASKGFARTLTKEQLRNVARLAGLSAGATFSVPGAGKTTEALALFVLRAKPGDRLLVIAPKNAFGAWDEQLGICLPRVAGSFVRLRGGRDRIEELLRHDPGFMLITYQQLPRVKDLIAEHISESPSFVFLDESHRIKSGKQRVTAESVLSLSHLPVGKLLLSGTPMPQSEEDLVPQFSFLYPEMHIDSSTVSEFIKPVYVRTTKRELDLPEVDRKLIALNLAPVQAKLYALMRSEVARQAENALNTRNRFAFRSLGRSIMRLLQVVSNPALLAKEIGFAHEGLLADLLEEGKAPKVQYACLRARQLARQGRKSLIWTSFVSNVELIAQRLADLGAVFIHGGVDAGDEDDEETREGKIKAFHDDATIKVMVANPAAASEGISLHTVCQNAIYVDRTFNAAHYLQSEDRIHRLGLRKDQVPTVEILECRGTIDEIVRLRLGLKVDRMSAVLEDPSLNVDPIPFGTTGLDDADDDEAGINEDDIAAIIRGLKQGEGE